jgi:hypothetical protein
MLIISPSVKGIVRFFRQASVFLIPKTPFVYVFPISGGKNEPEQASRSITGRRKKMKNIRQAEHNIPRQIA